MQKLLINKTTAEIEELEMQFMACIAMSKMLIREKLNSLILKEKDAKNISFLEYISNDQVFNSILVGKISELDNIIEEIEKSHKEVVFWQTGKGGASSTPFGVQILDAFNYNGLRQSDYFKAFYLEILPKTCSYCNQHQLQALILENGIKLLCDFDHFYPKVYFPFLSASFYNLIPSCNVCNSRVKGANYYKSVDIIYPFADSFDSICNFTLDRVISAPVDNGFVISLENPSKNFKIDNHNAEFEIKKRYKDYRKEVLSLVQESLCLTDEEINRNVALFQQHDLSFSREKYIDNAIRATLNPNRILDYPKGKFIKDIALRLGINY